MSQIDLIVEKYLDTVKYQLMPGFVLDIEVFVNPSNKERMDIINDPDHYDRALRFIADNKTKKLYVFSVAALHDNVWTKIGDGRKLYSSSDLLVGTQEANGKVDFGSSYLYSIQSWNSIMDTDWSWTDRYIKGLTKTLSKEKKHEE